MHIRTFHVRIRGPVAAPVAAILVLAAAGVGIALGMAIALVVGVAAVAVGSGPLARRALSPRDRPPHGLDPAREVFPPPSAGTTLPARPDASPPRGGAGAD
ncbi:MAG: hypothetical protein NVS9B3_09690 [Gemmatimonadaceae bacterium]